MRRCGLQAAPICVWGHGTAKKVTFLCPNAAFFLSLGFSYLLAMADSSVLRCRALPIVHLLTSSSLFEAECPV